MAFTTMERFRDEQGHEVMLRWNFDDHGLLTSLDIADEAKPDEVRVMHPLSPHNPRRPVDSDAPLPLEIQ